MGLGEKMDLRCPKCNGTDLKKVSMAYQEGLYRGEGHGRLRAAIVGGSGPDLVVGRASTRALHQSELSKQLGPPVKWSYRKVIGWSVLAFLCLAWLVFYADRVTTNAKAVISATLVPLGVIAGVVLAGVFFLSWRHNHSTYQREYAEWNRSFICQRCGAMSQHNGQGAPS